MRKRWRGEKEEVQVSVAFTCGQLSSSSQDFPVAYQVFNSRVGWDSIRTRSFIIYWISQMCTTTLIATSIYGIDNENILYLLRARPWKQYSR